MIRNLIASIKERLSPKVYMTRWKIVYPDLSTPLLTYRGAISIGMVASHGIIEFWSTTPSMGTKTVVLMEYYGQTGEVEEWLQRMSKIMYSGLLNPQIK